MILGLDEDDKVHHSNPQFLIDYSSALSITRDDLNTSFESINACGVTVTDQLSNPHPISQNQSTSSPNILFLDEVAEYLENLHKSTNWKDIVDVEKTKRSKSLDSLATYNIKGFEAGNTNNIEGEGKVVVPLSLNYESDNKNEGIIKSNEKSNQVEECETKTDVQNKKLDNFEPTKICNITVPKTLVHSASFYAEIEEKKDSIEVFPPSLRKGEAEIINQTDEELG